MSLVMGTAGHIDHGKTSLINALTGINCDRLDEENKRGITIELGFAFLDLENGNRLSIVDVPGHERFIQSMMAGSYGIDFVMLIVAADEGVMPQTREHLDICSLLGIKEGLIVITKKDLVDEEMLELVKEDINNLVKNTFLENACVLAVSSRTGDGIDELKHLLTLMDKKLGSKLRPDLFRMPIDRVFTLKGHGTVVTGTMIAGSIEVNENIIIYPEQINSKVRSLQSHGSSTNTAFSGKRTAINLLNVHTDDISRGFVVARPNTLEPSKAWIVSINCLKSSSKPLKNRKEVHLYHGTTAKMAKIYLLDKDKLEPGESSKAILKFEEDMVGVFEDKFVIRSFSPLQTIAGGVILYPMNINIKKKSKAFNLQINALEELEKSIEAESSSLSKKSSTFLQARIESSLILAGLDGLTFNKLILATNSSSKPLLESLNVLGAKQSVFCFDKETQSYINSLCLEESYASCLKFIKEYHKQNPLKQGISKVELVTGWGQSIQQKLAYFVIERLLITKKLNSCGDTVFLPDYVVKIDVNTDSTKQKIYDAHLKAGMAPPNMKDVLDELKIKQENASPVLSLLQKEQKLTKINESIWYATTHLDEIKAKVEERSKKEEHLDIAGLKEITGLSRKYLIALLEYFDNSHYTIRIGDKRILRQKTI